MPVTLAIVTHETNCVAGLLGDAWEDAGIELRIFAPYLDVNDLPTDLARYDGLVVLGGHMGANSDDDYPWLAPTKALLVDAIRKDVPTLGVCLGHQLLASALGGTVDVNDLGTRIGLTSVALTDAGRDDEVLASSVARRATHWNEDVVTYLPAGAVRLATAPDGTVQAARYAPRAWGVQFHPEVTAAIFRSWDEEDPSLPNIQGIGDSIAAAEEELRTTWAPLALRFAAQLKTAACSFA
ncbi:MAG: type 1 glutamine amidotransferase [Allobranchiibius sp.]